jgi:hypothetical protein
MATSSFDTTVRGGMPVTVCCEFGQPDPGVGIFYPEIEDIWLEVRGRRAVWLEARLTDAEWETLHEQVYACTI